jgi:phosphoadenosine phosphosulfate reductase
MGLVNETLFGTVDKVKIAIDRLRQFEPSEGYYGAFSGGKDSETIKKLANLAGVRVDWRYNVTGIDPPELVYHIRNNHPDVIFEMYKKSMWKLIVEKGIPPTRIMRYCCEALKEGGGEGRFVITGVRWAESVKRKLNRGIVEITGNKTKDKHIFLNIDNDTERRITETCVTKGKRILNPIVDWNDSDVWEFIREYQIKYCSLYDEGFKRLGCIGCPMARRGAD